MTEENVGSGAESVAFAVRQLGKPQKCYTDTPGDTKQGCKSIVLHITSNGV